jgi:LysR family glycine cleavage system transcriptional activator
MADRGPPFAALRALEAACRLKSYSLAGDELGVTHSAVSQSVRRLEQTYGQRLFWRQGTGMSPSPAAVALAQAYREAERVLVRAAEDLKTKEGEGSLVLSTLPSIAKLWLGPKLGRLQEAMPGIMVEVRTSRDLANLHADGVDVALRVGLGRWPNLRAELLFEEYVFPVCSPEFLARHHDHICTDECIANGPGSRRPDSPRRFRCAGRCSTTRRSASRRPRPGSALRWCAGCTRRRRSPTAGWRASPTSA